jgi:uncharacterized coiled-coil protein SlyX
VIFDDEKPEAYHWRRITEKRLDELEMNVATKNDIAELKLLIVESENRMAVRFVEFKGEIQAKFIEHSSAIQAQLIEHSGTIQAQLIEHKGEVNAQIAELKGEIKAQIADAKTSIIQWVVTAVLIAQLLPMLLKLFIPG